MRGDFSENELTFNILKNERFGYLGIDSYFTPETEIEYESDVYSISCIKGDVTAYEKKYKSYIRPKIMYVPAERNFLSVVNDKSASVMGELPETLYKLNDEYNKAKRLIGKTLEPLPVDNTYFFYDEKKATSYVTDRNKSFKIPLSKSASGIQSLIPLILVSRFLSDKKKNDVSISKRPLTLIAANRIKSKIENMNLPREFHLD
jgi:hypothetical protein